MIGKQGATGARTIVLLLSLAIAGGIGLTLFVHWETAHLIDFFSSALRRAETTESVTLDSRKYLVTDGTVTNASGTAIAGAVQLEALRLAYEKTLARRSPLMSLAGTDPRKLATAIASLQEAQQTLAAQQKVQADAQLVKTSLYPIDFLSDAAALETDREAFLSSGSDVSARAYEQQLGKTIADYEKDLSNYRAAFLRVVPASIRSYSSAGLVIDRSHTLAAIDSLSAGGRQTFELHLARLACLSGTVQDCDTTQLQFPSVQISGNPALSAQQLATAAAVNDLIIKTEGLKIYSVSPLIETSASVCAADSKIPPIFSVDQQASYVDKDVSLESLKLVGDMRYTVTADFPDLPYEAFFAKRGIAYVPDAPLLHYECPYMETDFANAFAVEAASHIAANIPFSDHATGTERQSLLSMERALEGSAGLITEGDAGSYAQAGKEIGLASSTPQTVRDEATELALVLKDRSAGFAQAIAWMAEIEKWNTEGAVQNGVPVDLTAATLFYYRSGFLLLFMASNPSVQPDQPSYFETVSVPASEQPFVYYSDLARSPATLAELTHDMTVYYGLHRSPGSAK